jgi:hypothetical protein
MTPNLDEALTIKYPKIFKNRYGSMRETCMFWGFSHDDGWYNIIDMLCSNIQRHVDWTRKQRADALKYNRALSGAIKGDFTSYNRLSKWQQKNIDEDLMDPEPQLKTVPKACPQVIADQVKEKFGTLCFYYHGGDDKVDGMVRMAESMSAVTCETCGAPGVLRGGGWLQTLCDAHAGDREPASMEF